MRVLHIIPGLDPKSGGPAAAIGGLAPAQVKAGLEVSLLAAFRIDANPSIMEKLRAAGVAIHMIGPVVGALGRHPAIVPTLRKAVASADVIHIHALWEETQHQAAVAARLSAKPYIFRPCGMLDPWSLNQSKWRKKLYMFLRLRRDLSGAVALHFTANLERDLAAPLLLPPKAIVEPNGIDLSEFLELPAKDTFRHRYPRIGQRPILLFLSRIHPKKGLDVLVPAFTRAMARWKQQLPVGSLPILVIAGPDADNYEAQVRRNTQALGLEEDVLFVGPLFGEHKVAAFADADLFVLPSHQENFGIVVVEAMAAGCPVLISDQVNIHPQITAWGAGWVVPVNADRLAEQLQQCLCSPLQRRAAGAAGRAAARLHYDWNAIGARWAEHYQTIIQKQSSTSQ